MRLSYCFSSAASRVLLRRAVLRLCLILVGLFVHLVPSAAGTWKIVGTYAGSCTTTDTHTGTNFAYYDELDNSAAQGTVDLAQIPAVTSNSGGISPDLEASVHGRVSQGSVTQDMEGSGDLVLTLTWQPKNGDSVADPAPRRVTVYYRHRINANTGVSAEGVGSSQDNSAQASVDGLATPLLEMSVSGPSTGGTDMPPTYLDPFQTATLNVANGSASKQFSITWSLKTNVNAAGSDNLSFGSTARDMAVDFCVEGFDRSRFPSRLAGNQTAPAFDPSFTRWLPLSFSPSVNSQPFRVQTGALAAPWGNVNCYYSLAVRAEPAAPLTANMDLALRDILYVPSLGADGTYNLPTTPYTVQAPPGLDADSVVPAYAITDTTGDRLVFDANFHPYSDIHSTFINEGDGTYQLTNAGPPGSLREKGYYTYTFDSLAHGGRLTQIADHLGNTQNLIYGGSAYLTVTDSSSGRSLIFNTGAGGYMNFVDAPGPGGTAYEHTILTYDSTGHMTARSVYPGGGQTALVTDSFTYGGPNNDSITASTQGLEQKSFTYVANQLLPDPFFLNTPRVSTEVSGSGTDTSSSDDSQSVQGTWSYVFGEPNKGYGEWGVDARSTTITDARSNQSTLIYTLDGGADGPIVGWKAIEPDYNGAPLNSNVSSTAYTPNEIHPTQVVYTDPLGHLFTTKLSSIGSVTSTVDALNDTWSAAYSTDGRLLTSVTDPTNVVWHFNYGENGNPANALTSIVDPASVTRESISYNSYGQVTGETVPATVSASGVAETTQLTYDPTTGDQKGITSPVGDQMTMDSFSPLGEPLSATVYPDTGNPANSAYPLRTSVTYNSAEFLTGITNPAGLTLTPTYTNGVMTQMQFLNQGNVLSTLALSLDTRGRLYSAADSVGTMAQYRYDKNSNTTRVLDGKANSTTLLYGPVNEPTGMTWPDGTHSTSIRYDAAGRLVSTTDEKNQNTSYFYDNADRLTDIQFSSDTSQNLHVNYDNADRETSATDGTGSTAFSYDATFGRLTGATATINALPAGSQNFGVSYTYYPDGKRHTMVSPAGTTTYTWDAADRLSSLTSPFGETTVWSYDHAGRIVSQTTTTATGTQLASICTYGASGQSGDPSTAPFYPRTLLQKINGASYWTYTVEHSYLGQVLSQTGSGSDGTAESESYSFDARGRLVSDSEQYNGGGHNYTNSGSSGYDLANNLNGQAGAWTYNSDNQLTISNSGLGGLPAATGLSYDNSGNLAGLNGMTLNYGVRGLLSSVTGAPAGTVSFTYDFNGRRVSKTAAGQTTYYLYDGGDLIAEINGSGQVTTVYTWGPQGLISDRINLQGTPQSRFYMFDASSSTRSLLDQNGVGLSRGSYSAWGSSTGYSPGTPLAWNGRAGGYTDSETGLVLMGDRYYAPSLGRFLSRDPLGFRGGINLYAYCGNDPVDLTDPAGDASSFADPYWDQVGDMLSGELSAAANPVNAVNMVKGVVGAEKFLSGSNWKLSAWKHLGGMMVNGLNPFNAPDPEGLGQAVMGDLIIASPLIKKIPLPNFAAAGEVGVVEVGATVESTTPAVVLRRPYIRQWVRQAVEDDAERTPDGRPIDPNTRAPIDGKPDFGHTRENEFWKHKRAAEREGLTQKEFNERMNDPSKYQLEDPSSNRSRRYEAP